jgi:hypothetical protein
LAVARRVHSIRFDTIPPSDLFDAGVTPECYLLQWQSDRTREIVHWAVIKHPGLTIADVL